MGQIGVPHQDLNLNIVYQKHVCYQLHHEAQKKPASFQKRVHPNHMFADLAYNPSLPVMLKHRVAFELRLLLSKHDFSFGLFC